MRRILFMIAMAAAVSFVPTARAQDYGDPNDIVYHWYRAYLGRDPDPSGAGYWADQLRQGNDPNSVLSALLGSDEYYQRAGSRPDGFVGKLYVDLLGRAPSAGEVDFWVRRLYTESRQDVANQILTQNAGAWVGTFRLPVRDRDRWYRDHDHERERAELLRREREREIQREHDRHDYRRPYIPIPH
jgi:hypothetical protein